ncbi:hypothetical protein BBJ28_00023497 [Nothophytophthora sp. Chile5]|nr:hypothetical protein BBJ28_00023497 [Nothophytophthora sp. Chile5]
MASSNSTEQAALHLQPLQEDGNDEDSSAYVPCETPGGDDDHDRHPVVTVGLPLKDDLHDPERISSVVKMVRFGAASDAPLFVPDDHDQRSRDAASVSTRRLRATEIQWTLKTRTFRTCVILAMPWAASSVLNTVFSDVRQSYMESMGISDFTPRFAPSLIQFFLGPILGAMSDRSLSKWGRRNVFLVVADVMLTVSGLLFGSASVLFPHYHPLTRLLLVLLCVGVLLLNIGLRARIMDEVPIEFQVHAQAALAMWEGVGGVLGSLLFRSTTDAVVFASAISGEDILQAFGAAMAAIFAATVACIYLRTEHPQDKPMFRSPLGRVGREAWQQVLYAPKVFRFLCIVYFVLSYVHTCALWTIGWLE